MEIQQMRYGNNKILTWQAATIDGQVSEGRGGYPSPRHPEMGVSTLHPPKKSINDNLRLWRRMIQSDQGGGCDNQPRIEEEGAALHSVRMKMRVPYLREGKRTA